MCGHAIIAVMTLAIKRGLVRKDLARYDGSKIDLILSAPTALRPREQKFL